MILKHSITHNKNNGKKYICFMMKEQGNGDLRVAVFTDWRTVKVINVFICGSTLCKIK